MSAYLVKGKGWRYDFILKGVRYTDQWYKTTAEAKRAEARKRQEVLYGPWEPVSQDNQASGQKTAPKPLESPLTETETSDQTPTGMAFLEVLNSRLDHVKAYNSESHYRDYVYLAKRWAKEWGKLPVDGVTRAMVEKFVLSRRKVSAFVANKEIRYLRATFNFAKKREWMEKNPAEGVEFFPVEKALKHVPEPDDLDKVIAVAEPKTQDYLWTLRDTMARVGEINALTWKDVDLERRFLVLYTRKKKGGNRTPRKIPMTSRLHEILTRLHAERDKNVPSVFWHDFYDRKTGEKKRGPYKDRKDLMRGLCKRAGVQYFRYHAFRHSGASVMEGANIPIGSIQRLLGHENRLTTEIYLHSLGQAERDAINVFEAIGKKSHTNPHTP